MADESGLTGSWEHAPRRRVGRAVVVGLCLIAVVALAFGARGSDGEPDGFVIEPENGGDAALPVEGDDEALGTWVDMADGPLGARVYAEHVWTGTELVIVGGFADHFDALEDHVGSPEVREDRWLDDGAAYNPATDSWHRISDPPSGAGVWRLLWTGEEVVAVVWEGPAFEDGEVSGPGTATLHAWTPGTDAWRAVAPPREPGHDIRWVTTVGGDLVVATSGRGDWGDHARWALWAQQDGLDWARLPDVPLVLPAALEDLDGDLLVAGSDGRSPRLVVLEGEDWVDIDLGAVAIDVVDGSARPTDDDQTVFWSARATRGHDGAVIVHGIVDAFSRSRGTLSSSHDLGVRVHPDHSVDVLDPPPGSGDPAAPGGRGDVVAQFDTPVGLLAVPLEQPHQVRMRAHPAGPWQAMSDEVGPTLEGAVVEWVDDRLVVWGGRHPESGEVRSTGELWLPHVEAP